MAAGKASQERFLVSLEGIPGSGVQVTMKLFPVALRKAGRYETSSVAYFPWIELGKFGGQVS